MKIGQKLADMRKMNGYTQKQLACKLNVSQQIISNIERNTTSPDVDLLQRIADLYEVPVDELIGRKIGYKKLDSWEQRILSYMEQLDESGKELSLCLVKQVVQNRGKKND